jgi:hypothetical protein
MAATAHDLACRLADQAEAVCRHYLSNGRREGHYWLVGDVRNTPGRSTYVRLKNTSKGPAGKWNDAATGEHGDLLDVIRESCGLIDFAEVAKEARSFLTLPGTKTAASPKRAVDVPAPRGSVEAARRLFAVSRPISGTLVERYLRGRGIIALHETGKLRFHPRCYYRQDEHKPTEVRPAMIAAVTDLTGQITGVHRTWLAPDGVAKASIDVQRKAIGDLLGHAVRFGDPVDVMAAGEGIETVLSLRQSLPDMAMSAALSAAHLAGLLFPETLRRLYVGCDNDPAGRRAQLSLTERASAAGIEVVVLSPILGDFNEDLRHHGIDALRANVRVQLVPYDVERFMARAK